MADISKITLPSGSVYNIKDAQARSDIESIRSAVSGGVSFLGITTTELTDGATTTTVVIDGNNISAINGGIAIYGNNEFIYADSDSKWHKLGSADDLGALAHKDTATGTYTPAGSINTPTITVTPNTTVVNSITAVGSLPAWSATVSNENLTISWDEGALPTKGENTTVATGIQSASSDPLTFTGTSATISVS